MTSRPDRKRDRGRFVVLVGPDGTGKTTIATQLIDGHRGPTMYIHFRPDPLRRPDERPAANPSPPPKRRSPGPAPVGWGRIAWSLTLFWLGYLRWVRPALKNGALVLGDRWVYGYLAQPIALGFAGPVWLARAVCAIAPRPDLVVRLTAPAEVVASRKPDLTVTEIIAEQAVWDTVPHVGITLDTLAQPSETAGKIRTSLQLES